MPKKLDKTPMLLDFEKGFKKEYGRGPNIKEQWAFFAGVIKGLDTKKKILNRK